MSEQRNFILFAVIAVAILLGFQYFQKPPPPPQQQHAVSTPATPAPSAPVALPSPAFDRSQAISAGPRLAIDTPRLKGSISLRGARFDDVSLRNYHETVDPRSPNIELLSPTGTANPYFAEFGWIADTPGTALPKADTVWNASAPVLGLDHPVTLRWDNGQGLRFERTIAVDADFMLTITDRIANSGGTAVPLQPYGLISRTNTPKISGSYLSYEGPLGVFEGTESDVKYKTLQEKGDVEKNNVGGWIGFTDKYWLTALIPAPGAHTTDHFTYRNEDGVERYQVDILGDKMTLQPGGSATVQTRLFTGAKEVRVLDHYAAAEKIDRFDLAIDFGWFYFLTKPIFYLLRSIHDHVGNFGLSIMLLTVVIKALFFPLANKSFKAMSQMKKLQPEMKKLQERFADDKARLNQEMMALYKREKANPLSGCLPIVVQIPVFFSLYKVLFVNIEMRHAPFFGWIHDLSAPDPTTLFNLFGLIPWTPPTILMIGVWPLIYGATMFVQQKLNPAPPDPVQAKVFMFMPIMFTYMFAQFPAGLVIYYAWNNLLTIAQQWVIMKRAGAV